MSAFVFEGMSVTGSPEAVIRLQVVFERLKWLEEFARHFKGYPSIIELMKLIPEEK